MRLWCVVTALAMVSGNAFAATGDTAVDALIDKLLEKGVISGEDARQLEDEVKKPVREQKPAPVAGPSEKLGEAKKEPKLKLPFEVKVRAQGRLDTGDLLVGDDKGYKTETDFFLRRVRLEVDKEFKAPPLGKELDLNLTLNADRAGQNFRGGKRVEPSDRVNVHYIYGDWVLADWFGVEIGKHKLPFLRAELTSSAKQLLIERPNSDSAANDTFGSYRQPHIMLHGELMKASVRYFLSYADGTSELDELQDLDPNATATQKQGWGNAFIGRIEISPMGIGGSGFTETKKDDTGIGREDHLTLGIDGGVQQGMKYTAGDVTDARLDSSLFSIDLAGRYTFGAMGTITGQAQYLSFRRDFNYRGKENPQAGYFQAGYLLPWGVLRGRIEPAARYEIFDHDRIEKRGGSGSREKTYTLGFNHYILNHNIKWSYNFVHTLFDAGIAEAGTDRTRDLHQVLLQLYF